MGTKVTVEMQFLFSSSIHNPHSCNLVAHGHVALGSKLSLVVSISVFNSIISCIYVLLANNLAPLNEIMRLVLGQCGMG
jgi:hypothetical protein